MSEENSNKDNFTEEFHNLGVNIAGAIRAAWDTPERKRLQDDIVNGVTELGLTLKQEADHLANSPTGRQLKTDVEVLGERMRSTETHEKIRGEIVSVLQSANAGLQTIIDKWSQPDDTVPEAPTDSKSETE